MHAPLILQFYPHSSEDRMPLFFPHLITFPFTILCLLRKKNAEQIELPGYGTSNGSLGNVRSADREAAR